MIIDVVNVITQIKPDMTIFMFNILLETQVQTNASDNILKVIKVVNLYTSQGIHFIYTIGFKFYFSPVASIKSSFVQSFIH